MTDHNHYGGDPESLLSVSYPNAQLSDLVLTIENRRRLWNVVMEQRQWDKITFHGLQPVRRLLFTGPPGTGKTSTAQALAGELGVPLYTVRLDLLTTQPKDEGEAEFRQVLDTLRQTYGVFVFDGVAEFTEENRWILVMLQQFLMQDTSKSVIIVASNRPQLLDGVIFEQCDRIVNFGLPTSDEARAIIEGQLAMFDLRNISWASVLTAVDGLSHAEISTVAGSVAEHVMLTNAPVSWARHLTAELGRARQ